MTNPQQLSPTTRHITPPIRQRITHHQQPLSPPQTRMPLNISHHLRLRLRIIIHIRPLTLQQPTLHRLIQHPIRLIHPQLITKQQILPNLRIPLTQNMHMHIPLSSPHHPMPPLPNTQLIPGTQQPRQITPLRLHISNHQQHIHNRLSPQPRNRRRTNMMHCQRHIT